MKSGACLVDVHDRRWQAGGSHAAEYGDDAEGNVRGKRTGAATQPQHDLAAAAAAAATAADARAIGAIEQEQPHGLQVLQRTNRRLRVLEQGRVHLASGRRSVLPCGLE
jgi:hypothetical protein